MIKYGLYKMAPFSLHWFEYCVTECICDPSIHVYSTQEKTTAELEWLKVKQQKMRGKGEDDHMPLLETRQRGLLKKLEAEQAEIRRLQRVQQEASREHRLMMEQHREISHLHHSAKYYRDKLRRYSMRDTQDHLTPSPSHHSTSPVPSEVASQVRVM